MAVTSSSELAGREKSPASSEPSNARMVLLTLIIIAAVANLPLAMANVALPSIGAAFDASQTQLTWWR